MHCWRCKEFIMTTLYNEMVFWTNWNSQGLLQLFSFVFLVSDGRQVTAN